MSDAPPGNGPSSQAALGRGLLILLVAVIIGVLVLNSLDNKTKKASAKSETTTTTKAKATTTTTTPLRSPANVKVLVVNASGVSGVAQTASSSLSQSKYSTLTPATATTKESKTMVYYEPGYEQEAQVLATTLSLPLANVSPMPTNKSAIPVSDTAGADILVIIGTDQASSFKPQTTSTVAHSTTTAKSTSTT
jgi:hypothetical protein